MSENILKVTNIKKSFAGVRALKEVSLEIRKGEIHCLAGENGCGKSTLIKIISGVLEKDSGEIEIDGVKYNKITPVEAIMSGVQVIYQDFSIFPNLTVMENLVLNNELANKRKFVNWRKCRELAKKAIAQIGYSVDLNEKVENLATADKQLIAICRALMNNAKLIIMDEPTTSLTKKEVKALFVTMKQLQARGIAILFISHKIEEIFEISDRFSILRSGENIITSDTNELNNESFTYYMTGRKFKVSPFEANIKEDIPLLKVKNLSSSHGYSDISFELKKGEILGITGLLGSGRTELALTLFGALKADSGETIINGKKVELNSIAKAIKNKIGYIPEDRLTEGLFLSQSIGKNIAISKIDELSSSRGILNNELINEKINSLINKLSIATPDHSRAVQTLSGGNQQRVVIAKWLALDLDILILNGPTAGVDIGSKYDIHKILQKLAAKGMGIIIISDDIPEVITSCNRILIMKKGKISGAINSKEITESELAERVIMDTIET